MTDSSYILNKKLLTSDRDRFFNCIIDSFFIFISIFVVAFLVIIIEKISNWDIYDPWVDIMEKLGMFGAYVSFAIFYYLIFEWLFGRTIGKIITGCVVVNENGLKPNFKVICIRTLCRLIPLDALSFLGKSERIWHDSLSKTYVVEKKDLLKDMEIFYGLNLIGVKEEN
ncbi:RDD family protein [Flavobacterium daemonense]|uniref:RDD family protein n=1 Tax=Flavobacterium daemonense TaxID=1393049 RepID=UPI0013A663DE|nr:RDD family protein [Flavobacterium daemonense]KAF2334357.1 RDD family protein [Flavobacterium daemonense]